MKWYHRDLIGLVFVLACILAVGYILATGKF